MKLLFLLYAYYPDFEANSLIIDSLAKVFTESGHEVHVLPMKTYFNASEDEQWEGVKIHRITNSFEPQQITRFLHAHHYIRAFRLALALLRDRFQSKEYLKLSWSYFSYKRFCSIIKQHHIDIVINICYPIEACLPVMRYIKSYPKSFRWIIYMLDPFATNYYYLSKYSRDELLSFQTKVFDQANKIIVTPLIMAELKKIVEEPQLIKYLDLNFPKIVKPYITPSKDDLQFDRHEINCVFVGKFNKETRNPRYLFRLFEGLGQDRIKLHIIGEEREQWSSMLPVTQNNIIFHGMKSKHAALNAELNCNILINIGNSMPNQMPSKLLEYISTGKPIVNLYKLENCPTLTFMRFYPIHFNIYEKHTDYAWTLQRLRHFLRRYRKTNISYHIIRRKFYYCTLDYVSSEFLNLFDELMEDT